MNFNIKKTMINLIVTILLFLIILTFINCINYQHKQAIESDHKKIKAILDKALLSNDPIKSFNEAVPKIKEYPTVDSVWVSGTTFYVKYKKGGLVSWTVSPDKLIKNDN